MHNSLDAGQCVHCFTRALTLYLTAFVADIADASRSISLEEPCLSRSRCCLFTSYPRGYPLSVASKTRKYRNSPRAICCTSYSSNAACTIPFVTNNSQCGAVRHCVLCVANISGVAVNACVAPEICRLCGKQISREILAADPHFPDVEKKWKNLINGDIPTFLIFSFFQRLRVLKGLRGIWSTT